MILFGAGCDKLKSRDQSEQGRTGVQAMPSTVTRSRSSRKPSSSIRTIRTPACTWPTAYMSQYIPGADSPENMQNATAAANEFRKVLEKDPKNTIALASMALRCTTTKPGTSARPEVKKLDEAREWYMKARSSGSEEQAGLLQPRRYRLGQVVSAADVSARAKLGMKPEDPGPDQGQEGPRGAQGAVRLGHSGGHPESGEGTPD